jgi:uncharacterized protein with GYD domain
MPLFAQQIAYQPVAWQALIKNPQNRLDALRDVVAGLGGRIIDGWLTLGDFDALVICELPDEGTAAAFSMAVGAGGAMRAVKTTPLISMADGVESMRKASQAAYTPPASEIPYFGVYRRPERDV